MDERDRPLDVLSETFQTLRTNCRTRAYISARRLREYARSNARRHSEFHHSWRGAALQWANSGGNPLADFDTGILDWKRRHARLDLPHHRRVYRLLIRERTSCAGVAQVRTAPQCRQAGSLSWAHNFKKFSRIILP